MNGRLVYSSLPEKPRCQVLECLNDKVGVSANAGTQVGRMVSRLTRFLAALSLALLVGCSTPSTPTTGAAPAAEAARPALQKGMAMDAVEKSWGTPAERNLDGPIELWSYRRLLKTESTQVATGTEERPYFDPFSGESRPVTEPIYQQRSVRVEEVITLGFQEGRLIGWTRKVERSSSFDS